MDENDQIPDESQHEEEQFCEMNEENITEEIFQIEEEEQLQQEEEEEQVYINDPVMQNNNTDETQGFEIYQIVEEEDIDEDDSIMSDIKLDNNKVILLKNDETLQCNSSSNDELTQQMRAAHKAKEQLKKHKCPYCTKCFMFPSKGKLSKENV